MGVRRSECLTGCQFVEDSTDGADPMVCCGTIRLEDAERGETLCRSHRRRG